MLHTGFAVDSLDDAIELYKKLGFSLSKRFEKPEPACHIAQMNRQDGAGIELVQFTSTDHPHVEYIKRHMAFASDDLEGDIQMLLDVGCELVIPISKGVSLTYAYVRDPSGNFLEIARDL
jgi:catechol 2,3-dioxygenase-like lactoylglutathione lyase family enzyme